MKERDLRDWLKEVFGKELRWFEHGFGGTAGIADVNIPLGSGASLPVELKMWERGLKGIACDVRPSQVRYHVLEALAGRRTAFLVGLGNGTDFELIAFPGLLVPRERFPKHSFPHSYISIGAKAGLKTFGKEHMKGSLQTLFASEAFWDIGPS